MGRPPILTERAHRRLLRAAKKEPKIEYNKLKEEVDMQNQISNRTITRALAEDGLSKWRAARRPKISATTAKKRRTLLSIGSTSIGMRRL